VNAALRHPISHKLVNMKLQSTQNDNCKKFPQIMQPIALHVKETRFKELQPPDKLPAKLGGEAQTTTNVAP
jgi:hypothetical protein